MTVARSGAGRVLLRRALLQPRVVGPVLVWSVLLGMLPHVAAGAPLPPAGTGSAHPDPVTLEARLVTAHLVALGLHPDEAARRLSAMSAEERGALALRLDELGAGGSPAGALAAAILVGLVVILILELMGRRVISRP